MGGEILLAKRKQSNPDQGILFDGETPIFTSPPKKKVKPHIPPAIQKPFVPSKYQQEYFDEISNPDGAKVIVLEARAGSGKTTTLVESLKLIPAGKTVLFLAFNKSIVSELKKRKVDAKTMHGFGHRICATMGYRFEMKKIDIICEELSIRYAYRSIVRQLLSLARCYLMPPASTKFPSASNRKKWDELRYNFCIEIPSESIPGAKVVRIQEMKNLSAEEREGLLNRNYFYDMLDLAYAKSFDVKQYGFDFDDMVFLPVFYKWPVPQFDYVFVDEAQDLNPCRLELMKMAIRDRAVFVGDSNQAIYGFCGAMPDSMDQICNQLDAKRMPLSISYRCSKSVIRQAQSVVPSIEASKDAPEGSVQSVKLCNPKPNDYVLCRITAPLVECCFQLLREGRCAIIRGREIGSDLINLVELIGGLTVSDFIRKAREYERRESQKLLLAERELQAAALGDKVETLLVFAENAQTRQEMKDRIKQMFTDGKKSGAVILSTIHKAKGLEADDVWIIKPDLMPFGKAKKDWEKQQEQNLIYVAITRAKLNLFWVHEEKELEDFD